ncbi:MAG: methionyl-tRNA formyltransferase [Chloroflexi bacterium]|nr:methionyl-tRNA formyltransferase [Chloroflexota bacterium]MCI0579013.1 methionyl-tRNA formyltransferase [Chloroflexota bacterium]MCI0644800.1 methionyl-tRNA formyltransferase [Chloroflexota bacterium]MCI0731975.1 methionyl-tRNA formyltransferase [Chloroflexota bacterium]
MGTPEFAVPALQKLIEMQQVVGVVTQPDRPAGRGRQLQPPPVKVAAEAASIPVYQPVSLRREEAAAPLAAWQPEMIVVAAFGQILRPHVLNLPPRGCLNVHASLLPRWRGASPIQHAILAGDAETGISLMQMDVGLDTGPVYVQQAIPIQPDETTATLHDRLAALGGEMLGQYLAGILAGRLIPTPQNDAQATYAPLIKKEAGQIDWTQSGTQIDRHVRAMTPWPGAFTTWQGKMLKVLAAAPLLDTRLPNGPAGQVEAYRDGVVILAGEGGLLLQTIQLAGKRAVSIEEFLRGRPDFIGSQLGV